MVSSCFAILPPEEYQRKKDLIHLIGSLASEQIQFMVHFIKDHKNNMPNATDSYARKLRPRGGV